ncbi:FliG C-terminal domain-containing protein, partial [Rubrivirga sp.]|uniref:FliG C-terminal domain-containing protein n=1 Tax=Rubrivirga sp. TaxID=1885344 RepID=UPI003C71B2A9
ASGGLEAARAVIGQLDQDRASIIEPRMLAATEGTGFDIAATKTPEDLAGFLEREHPQTIAVVLSRLPAKTAAGTLGRLPVDVRGDVIRRLSSLEETPASALRDLDEALRRRFAPGAGGRDGGVRRAADIITQSGRAVGDAILDDIRDRTPELAGQIRELLFVFEDLHRLDDRDLARVLSECDQGMLAKALHGATADFSDRALRCVSDRVGSALLEEIEMIGTQPADVIEEAHRYVIAIVLRLADEEAITIASSTASET